MRRLPEAIAREGLIWGITAGVTALLGWIALADGPQIGEVPLISPQGRLYWVITCIALLGVSGIVQWQHLREGARHEPVAWIAPALTIFSASLLLAVYADGIGTVLAIVVGTVVALAWHTGTHLLLEADDERSRAVGKLAHTLFVHMLALVLLAMIYVQKLRSLYSAAMVMVIVSMLVFLATQGLSRLREHRLLYAVLTGLVLGEITWALNYWRATGWLGGAVLFVCFYFITGLVLAHLEHVLRLQDVLEYGGVALIAFSILAWAILR